MTLNRAALKVNAKLDIKNTKPNIILVTLVYTIIIYILDMLRSTLSGETAQLEAMLAAYERGEVLTSLPLVKVGPAAWVLIMAIGVMTIMLGAGYKLFCLNTVRRHTPAWGNLFDPFGMFLKVLWLQILTGIFIWLWSMLFIIPGVIAAYRYRMALYIRLEHPEYSALDCLRRSKAMMEGRKAELFILDLSFIGWSLLTMIPFVSLWVTPYKELTNVWFYNSLAGAPAGGDPFAQPGDDNRPPWEG